MTRFGFTGSQKDMSVAQQEWLVGLLASRHSIHHGACIGSDETVHDIATRLGMKVVVHPPTDRTKMMLLISRVPLQILPPRPYLQRNRDIVDACELLLATPNSDERLRSGTWATVRYAVKVGKPVLICYPDGRVESR